MTVEQLIEWAGKASPGLIFAVMWWLERSDRIRLQNILEGFLPVVDANNRVNRALNRVIVSGGADPGADG